MPEFHTEWIEDKGIRVLDLRSGHDFLFKVIKTPDEIRVLALQVEFNSNPVSQMHHGPLVSRARNYAEAEMLAAKKIDRRSAV